MDEPIGYREGRSPYREWRSTRLPATLWTRDCAPGSSIVRPDGCMDLIWDGSRIFVAGPDTAPHTHRTDVAQTLTAIRLAPGVAPIVVGSPASELTDQRIDLADIAPRCASRWEDLVAGAPTPGEALESLAAAALAAAGGVPAWVQETVGSVRSGTPVAEVADRLGISARQLQRRCADHFGYGPKMLARILRVEAATRSLQVGTGLTETAHRHGYADYSHMFRDFRRMAGTSPAAFSPTTTTDQDSAAYRSTGVPSGSRTTA